MPSNLVLTSVLDLDLGKSFREIALFGTGLLNLAALESADEEELCDSPVCVDCCGEGCRGMRECSVVRSFEGG